MASLRTVLSCVRLASCVNAYRVFSHVLWDMPFCPELSLLDIEGGGEHLWELLFRPRSFSSSILRFSLRYVKELIVALCRLPGNRNGNSIFLLILYRVVYATNKFLSRLLVWILQ